MLITNPMFLNSRYQKLCYRECSAQSVPAYIPLELFLQFDSLLKNWTFSFARGNWKRSSNVIGLQRFIQTMRAIQGALIVASSIQIILGYSQVWGLFSRYIDCIWKCEIVKPTRVVLYCSSLLFWFSMQVFQSSWYGTSGCIGRLGIVSERISFGRCCCIREFVFDIEHPLIDSEYGTSI